MRTGIKGFVVVGAALVAVSQAHAVPVKYTFAGEITEILVFDPSQPTRPEVDEFVLNQAFSGELVFDTDAVEGPYRSLNPDNNQANYPSALLQLLVQSGSYSYLLPAPASINVADGLFGSDLDIFSAIGGGPMESTYQVAVMLSGSDSSIVGFEIPSLLDPAAFPDMYLTLRFSAPSAEGSGATVSGRISYWAAVSTVPEPGTLALFGLGLTGLGFARRRKLA